MTRYVLVEKGAASSGWFVYLATEAEAVARSARPGITCLHATTLLASGDEPYCRLLADDVAEWAGCKVKVHP